MRNCESRIFLVVIVRSQRRRSNLLQIALRPKDSSLHFLILGEQILTRPLTDEERLYNFVLPIFDRQGEVKYAA